MEREKSVGLSVFAMLALVALPELACCHLVARDLPPAVVCASEGQFPDPTDCRYYMNCTRNSDGSYTETISPCPDGTYYNSCQGNCSKTQLPTDCSISCDTQGAITVSSDNPSVYFVCIRNEDGWKLNVAKCPDGNAVVDTSCSGDFVNCPVNGGSGTTCNTTGYYGDDKNCSVYYYCSGVGETPDQVSCNTDQYFISYNHSCVEFHCTSEGWFADPANCSSFYSCVRDASDYIKTHLECPSGGHFDSSVGGCLIGDCATVCPGSSRYFKHTSSGMFADPLRSGWF